MGCEGRLAQWGEAVHAGKLELLVWIGASTGRATYALEARGGSGSRHCRRRGGGAGRRGLRGRPGTGSSDTDPIGDGIEGSSTGVELGADPMGCGAGRQLPAGQLIGLRRGRCAGGTAPAAANSSISEACKRGWSARPQLSSLEARAGRGGSGAAAHAQAAALIHVLHLQPNFVFLLTIFTFLFEGFLVVMPSTALFCTICNLRCKQGPSMGCTSFRMVDGMAECIINMKIIKKVEHYRSCRIYMEVRQSSPMLAPPTARVMKSSSWDPSKMIEVDLGPIDASI
ncbi:hypothetical protein D1007_50491 [Hordeum vulgare]|nr:hypothetical protein D1007_50491 [Hordeum vulgare]